MTFKRGWCAQVGKPSTFMLSHICDTFGIAPREICMVGDRLDTDIAFGLCVHRAVSHPSAIDHRIFRKYLCNQDPTLAPLSFFINFQSGDA